MSSDRNSNLESHRVMDSDQALDNRDPVSNLHIGYYVISDLKICEIPRSQIV